MKAVTILFAVAVIVHLAQAQSSSLQPPPLFSPAGAKNPQSANATRESSFPVPDASDLTAELHDALRSQAKPTPAYGLDRSRVQLAGAEEELGAVAPAQFMPNQRFPKRGVDGLLTTSGNHGSKDPVAGTGDKMTPIPRRKRALHTGNGSDDFRNLGDPKPRQLNLRDDYGASAYDSSDRNNRSIHSTSHQDPTSDLTLPEIPDTAAARKQETFLPANAGRTATENSFDKTGFDLGSSRPPLGSESTMTRQPTSQQNGSSVYGQTQHTAHESDMTRQPHVQSVAPRSDVIADNTFPKPSATTPNATATRRQQPTQYVQGESMTQGHVNAPTSAVPNRSTTYPQPTVPAATTSPQITAPQIPTQITPPSYQNGYQIAQGSSTPSFKPAGVGDTNGPQVIPTSPSTLTPSDTTITNGAGYTSDTQYSPRGSNFMTLLALFASIGLNIYLGWIAWDTYNRYQDLVADMRRTPGRRRERPERRERRLTESAAY